MAETSATMMKQLAKAKAKKESKKDKEDEKSTAESGNEGENDTGEVDVVVPHDDEDDDVEEVMKKVVTKNGVSEEDYEKNKDFFEDMFGRLSVDDAVAERMGNRMGVKDFTAEIQKQIDKSDLFGLMSEIVVHSGAGLNEDELKRLDLSKLLIVILHRISIAPIGREGKLPGVLFGSDVDVPIKDVIGTDRGSRKAYLSSSQMRMLSAAVLQLIEGMYLTAVDGDKVKYRQMVASWPTVRRFQRPFPRYTLYTQEAEGGVIMAMLDEPPGLYEKIKMDDLLEAVKEAKEASDKREKENEKKEKDKKKK